MFEPGNLRVTLKSKTTSALFNSLGRDKLTSTSILKEIGASHGLLHQKWLVEIKKSTRIFSEMPVKVKKKNYISFGRLLITCRN